MCKTVLRYMHLAGEVWLYLENGDIRKATGPEIARIIDEDPEFGLHFATQNESEPPELRMQTVSLASLDAPN